MKKFINKFKNVDKTKKLVILFITISFVFILGSTTYNTLTNNYETNKTEDITEEKNEKELDEIEIEVSEETKDEEESNQSGTLKNEEDNTPAINKNSSSLKTESTSNTETSSNTTTDKNNQDNSSNSNQSNSDNTTTTLANENISVNVQVIGMGNTMMSGNLTVEKGANAYSVLKELAAQKGIKITTSGFGKMVYVRGIGDLLEKQHGDLSGWMYKVNGNSPNIGAGSYTLSNGDNVVWYYVNYE